MVTGILNAGSNSDVYIRDNRKFNNISVRSGQYLYLAVHDCWNPGNHQILSRIKKLGFSES